MPAAPPIVLVPRQIPPRLRGQLAGVAHVLPAPTGKAPTGKARQAEFVVAPFAGTEALRDLLAALPRLRGVQTLSAGVEWIVGVMPAGVPLYSATGAHDIAVAEWTVAAILSMLRDVPGYARKQDEHRWAPKRGGELSTSRVTVVGFGSIGRRVARLLRPFGAQVTGVARRARRGVVPIDALDTVLPTTDILVNLLPMTAATHHLLGVRELKSLPDNALVVNAGRGGTIDQEALLLELRAGRLRAALDVTTPEPLPADHPLWDCPNLLLTQHSAGTVSKTTERAWALAVVQVQRFAAGLPLQNRVRSGY